MNRILFLAVILGSACVEHPIGTPAGDNNYDDPDDPGDPGQGSSGPDATADAYGQFCVAARDCPAVFACAYSIASACGAAGRCLPYNPDGGCTDAPLACSCTNTNVALCAPEGYAPVPVQSMSPCDGGTSDADTNEASTDDASQSDASDAASD